MWMTPPPVGTLGPGTLYTILAKFQEEGLIREAAVEGRKRTYAITERGRALFRQELSRLRLCVADGEREELASERLLPGMERRHREKAFSHAGGLLGYRPSGAVAGGKKLSRAGGRCHFLAMAAESLSRRSPGSSGIGWSPCGQRPMTPNVSGRRLTGKWGGSLPASWGLSGLCLRGPTGAGAVYRSLCPVSDLGEAAAAVPAT